MTQSVRYLQTLDIMSIHHRLCRAHGQPSALLSLDGLEAAVARPQLSIDGYEPFPGIWEKAAVLLDSLLQESPFLNLNALTGFIAANTLLELNGQERCPQSDDFEQVQSIHLHQLTIPQISEWLKRGSVKTG